MTTTTVEPARTGMSRRQRARLSRGAQYAVGLLLIAFLAIKTDWKSFSDSFFRLDIAASMWPRLLTEAIRNTLVYTALAFVFGLGLGLIIAMMKLSSIRPYRWFANGYVELFRGLPSLVVLFMVAYGIPNAFPGFKFPGDFFGMVTVGLGLTAAAYMAETIRAGIQAVPKGQWEAARSLGMSPGRTMFSIIIPQAFRIVIPPLTNELILLVKDSSLVYVLGVSVAQYELTKFGSTFLNTKASPTPLIVVALAYLAITLPLSSLVRALEKRFAKAR
ncbi:MAG: amino acid ABC transporter permease [Dermatophilaceae bacterium]|jgi:polar amino acid transport system permease protein|nr:amino acid ABC transporter permease [Dermatophilaceae bacterium]MBP9919469.1 amino acid ABC transporter permease [Dermatophilaceae bacterium]